MARPMKLSCCMFNKVFLVNTGVIFLIVVTNGYDLVILINAQAEKNDCFTSPIINVSVTLLSQCDNAPEWECALNVTITVRQYSGMGVCT